MSLLVLLSLTAGFGLLLLLAALIGIARLLLPRPGPRAVAKFYRRKAAVSRRIGDLQTAVVLEAAAARLERELGK